MSPKKTATKIQGWKDSKYKTVLGSQALEMALSLAVMWP